MLVCESESKLLALKDLASHKGRCCREEEDIKDQSFVYVK